MKIKPGKWNTRNNMQAVVLEVFEGIAYGRLFYIPTQEWISYSWDVNKNDRGFGNDLIAPWEEPKPRLRVWRRNSPGTIDHGTIKLLPEINGEPHEDWQPVPELDALFEKGKE